MGGENIGRPSVDKRHSGIAVLDSEGTVRWIDEAWAADEAEGRFPRVAIGSNLVGAYRAYSDSTGQAVVNGIVAVLEGKATYFEIEQRTDGESPGFCSTSVAALRGDGAGAVVMHKLVGRTQGPDREPGAEDRPSDGESIDGGVGLTPREREVLDLMAEGLDNRTISARLGIQYTTVRGHVRSVIAKLGSRSRLEAVARAYQRGVVPR
jgi:DNA-binding CsgD family transcriptional regulator